MQRIGEVFSGVMTLIFSDKSLLLTCSEDHWYGGANMNRRREPPMREHPSTPDSRIPRSLVRKLGDDLLPSKPTPVKRTLAIRRRGDVPESHPDVTFETRLVCPNPNDRSIFSALLLNISVDVVEELWISVNVHLSGVKHTMEHNARIRHPAKAHCAAWSTSGSLLVLLQLLH